jgi:hypothetical protein
MSAAGGRRPLGVAVAGFGWMGLVAHARLVWYLLGEVDSVVADT